MAFFIMDMIDSNKHISSAGETAKAYNQEYSEDVKVHQVRK